MFVPHMSHHTGQRCRACYQAGHAEVREVQQCQAVWKPLFSFAADPWHTCAHEECVEHMGVCTKCGKRVCSDCSRITRRVFTWAHPTSARRLLQRCTNGHPLLGQGTGPQCPEMVCSDCSLVCARCGSYVCLLHGSKEHGQNENIELCANCVDPGEADAHAGGRGTPPLHGSKQFMLFLK